MKIGIDLRPLQVGHEFRGIGRVVWSVVNELSKLPEFRANDVVFYHYDTSDPFEMLDLHPDFRYETIIVKNPKKPGGGKYKRGLLYAREILLNNFKISPLPHTSGLDVFMQFDQALGMPRYPWVKTVIVVHDLIPMAFKNEFLPSPFREWRRDSWKKALITTGKNARYYLGVKAIRRATVVVAVSKFTKEVVHDMLGIPNDRIIVAQNGVPHIQRVVPVDQKADLKKAKDNENPDLKTLIAESKKIPYLLFVGGVEPPRRKLGDLIAAFYHLRCQGYDIRLALVGKEVASRKHIPNAEAVELLRHLSYSDDVYCFGYANDADRNELFEHAYAFVFPSIYEGFGLPPLEAMAHGCPVITYGGSSLDEVVGDACIVTPSNFDGIIEAAKDLLDHPEKRDELISRGLSQAAKFSWDRSAKAVYGAIVAAKR